MSHHRKALKGVVIAAVAVLGTSLFTSCSSTPSGNPSGGSTTVQTLEFWDMAWGPTGTYDVEAQKLVDAFNAQNPDIHVNYTMKTWDNWYQTFEQAVGANAAPDVSTGGGFQPFGLEADANAIMPLNDLVAKWQSDGTAADFPNGILDYYKDSNGDYLGIPWAKDIRVFYYNKTLLQQAGIAEPPATWADFATDCKIVRDSIGGDTYGYAGGGTPHLTFMAGVGFGAGMFDANGNAQISTNPKELAALQWIASMGQGGSGCINPSATTYQHTDAQALYNQGKAAFIFDSPSFASNLTDPVLSETAILPPMANADGQKIGLYFTNGIMAYKQAEQRGHKEAAEKFIEYWSSVGGDLFKAGAGGVSPRTSIANDPAFASIPFYIDATKAYDAPVGVPLYAEASHGFAALNTIDGDTTMLDLERALYAGTPDVQTAANTAQQKVQGFIDSGQ